ncbi:MAG: cupredoxin domain-containing protein [Halobacteria archaeon]
MDIDRRKLLKLSASTGLITGAGCIEREPKTKVYDVSTVEINNSEFKPRNINVNEGDTVTWVNKDPIKHVVTNATKNWSFEKKLSKNQSAEYKFEDSGLYEVFCKFHGDDETLEGETMKIAVGDEKIENPLPNQEADYGRGVY